MRRRLAESLAVLLSVASLGAGAASGPNSSEAARVTKPPVVKTANQPTKKLSIRVLNVACIRPLDASAVIAAALETQHLIVVEDHNTEGGDRKSVV